MSIRDANSRDWWIQCVVCKAGFDARTSRPREDGEPCWDCVSFESCMACWGSGYVSDDGSPKECKACDASGIYNFISAKLPSEVEAEEYRHEERSHSQV